MNAVIKKNYGPGTVRDLSYSNIRRFEFNFKTTDIEKAKKMLLEKFEEYDKPNAVCCNLWKNNTKVGIIDYAPRGRWEMAFENKRHDFFIELF